MAIPVPNNRELLASAVCMHLPWGSFVHPYQGDMANNAWIAQRDRLFSAWTFTGVTPSATAVAAVINSYTLPATVIGYRVKFLPFAFVGTIDVGNKTSDTIPDSTYDTSEGYEVGNTIIYNNSDVYMCVDNSSGAAVWRKLN